MLPGSFRENPIIRPTARVLLLDQADRTLLFTAMTPDVQTGLPFWFPPGGGVEPGETHEEAAVRELIEETGLSVPLGPRLWSRRWLARVTKYGEFRTYRIRRRKRRAERSPQ